MDSKASALLWRLFDSLGWPQLYPPPATPAESLMLKFIAYRLAQVVPYISHIVVKIRIGWVVFNHNL